MPAILLVRHAQASFGTADYDVLSELGREQAGVLGRALSRRALNVTRVVSGTARRQADTAAVVHSSAATAEVEVDSRWNEYPTDEVLAHHGVTSARLHQSGPPGSAQISSRQFQDVLNVALTDWIAAGDTSSAAQRWPDFLAASNAALAEIGAGLGRRETALVFTSAGVIAAICAQLVGAANASFVDFNRVQVNTGVTKIVYGDTGLSLIGFNDHSHIEEAGGRLLTYR